MYNTGPSAQGQGQGTLNPYFNPQTATREPPKEQPVRQATGIAVAAGALVILAKHTGIAEFSVEEATVLVTAAALLGNEIARLRVFAKYK